MGKLPLAKILAVEKYVVESTTVEGDDGSGLYYSGATRKYGVSTE